MKSRCDSTSTGLVHFDAGRTFPVPGEGYRKTRRSFLTSEPLWRRHHATLSAIASPWNMHTLHTSAKCGLGCFSRLIWQLAVKWESKVTVQAVCFNRKWYYWEKQSRGASIHWLSSYHWQSADSVWADAQTGVHTAAVPSTHLRPQSKCNRIIHYPIRPLDGALQ